MHVGVPIAINVQECIRSKSSLLWSDGRSDHGVHCRLIRRQLKTETRAIVVQLLGGDRWSIESFECVHACINCMPCVVYVLAYVVDRSNDLSLIPCRLMELLCMFSAENKISIGRTYMLCENVRIYKKNMHPIQQVSTLAGTTVWPWHPCGLIFQC